MFFFTIPQRFKLSELLEIKQGIAIISKKESDRLVGQYNYKAIYISDLNNEFNSIDVGKMTTYTIDKELKTSKLLNFNDYVISCKGEIKGLSLYNVKDIFSSINKSGYDGIVVSNHFIILRPRQIALTIFHNVAFLHNLLTLLVPKINEYSLNKIGEKKIPFITISELERFSIQIPAFDVIQEKIKSYDIIFKIMKKREDELLSAKKEIDNFNSVILNEFKVEMQDN